VHKVIAGEAAAAVLQHKHIAATVSPTQILQPKVLSSKNSDHCQNKNTMLHRTESFQVSFAADKPINANY